jgi:branched-chain amino acid transport system substrate-binding protein
VLVEGAAPGRPRSRRAPAIVAALEGMRKFDMGGLEITYGPDDHTGLDFADLSIISDGRFKR